MRTSQELSQVNGRENMALASYRMKRIEYLMIVMLSMLLVASCESRGPKGNFYQNEKSLDDMVHDVLDAMEGDGWYYKYGVDLHKKVNGRWENAGRYSVYSNVHDDEDGCDLWVEFGTSFNRFPVYRVDKAGYHFRVQYMGEYYYF